MLVVVFVSVFDLLTFVELVREQIVHLHFACGVAAVVEQIVEVVEKTVVVAAVVALVVVLSAVLPENFLG